MQLLLWKSVFARTYYIYSLQNELLLKKAAATSLVNLLGGLHLREAVVKTRYPMDLTALKFSSMHLP